MEGFRDYLQHQFNQRAVELGNERARRIGTGTVAGILDFRLLSSLAPGMMKSREWVVEEQGV